MAGISSLLCHPGAWALDAISFCYQVAKSVARQLGCTPDLSPLPVYALAYGSLTQGPAGILSQLAVILAVPASPGPILSPSARGDTGQLLAVIGFALAHVIRLCHPDCLSALSLLGQSFSLR